ncbi:MAG: hypothetical protein ACI3XC_03315 [Phascolarctobacterium sp.]
MKILQRLALALGCVLALGGAVAVNGVEAGYHHYEEHRVGCEVQREACGPTAPRQACKNRSVMGRVNCRPNTGTWEAFTIDQDKLRAPSMLRMSGAITEIDGNKVVIRGEGQECVVALLNDDTYIVKGEKGKLRSAKELKVGQEVVAYYSARMTRSLPPQAQAFAIVIGNVRKEYVPQYFVVDQVQRAFDGSCVHVLNSTNDVIARIDKYACEGYASIEAGDKLLLWSRVMTMSLPGQTNAEKVVILR